MSGSIFLIDPQGGLVSMNAEDYVREEILQSLLAEYPALLAGEQIDPASPRRWLLVDREVGIPSSEETGNRWSVDHLFLDQEGVPTLVEVKRSTDTRIRREVVGQMLDYAANAIVYWPHETIRTTFETGCARAGHDPSERLRDFLDGSIDEQEIWLSVKKNLQAQRVRLIFVADEIPPELQRIVEFLNGQMDSAEVLALEIKQYVGAGRKTLVPRVLGQTADAQRVKGSANQRRWNEPLFFEELKARADSVTVEVARRLFRWAQQNTTVWWGKGAQTGSFVPCVELENKLLGLCAIYTYGRLEVHLMSITRHPPFDHEESRQELLARLNAIPGVDLPESSLNRRPPLPLSLFSSDEAFRGLISVFEWALDSLRDNA